MFSVKEENVDNNREILQMMVNVPHIIISLIIHGLRIQQVTSKWKMIKSLLFSILHKGKSLKNLGLTGLFLGFFLRRKPQKRR